ncbi:MAG: hypothetical protein WDM88_06700 [Galbitalea sp.]
MKILAGAKIWVGAIVVALLAVFIVVAPSPQQADAASAADFNAGYIISDANFYNSGAMSADQVQSFLAQEVPSCGGTCLVNYQQSTPSMAASNYCSAYAGSGSERASDIIAKVGVACGISQRVLLVLLEKEQGLVSSTNPGASAFSYATGFNCPNSCDPSYAGFFYQVYYAARQFEIYKASPTSWNYQAGRTNQILYSPNASCGTGAVFIQNAATAALYIYTPYQPDPAALANLYGTGDGCSSYGNRNFWRDYTDWFGSPIDPTSLVRTADNATVYLISGSTKYPIPSMAIYTALAPLGNLAFVSQQYVDSFTTGQLVGRVLRGPDGSIYFFDAGVILPFTTCAQVVDYGGSCGPTGYVQLTAEQIAHFAVGPTLGPVLGTTAGNRYYISNGTKAEILDAQSQALAGLPAGMVVLTEDAVSGLPLAAPIIRDGVFAATQSAAPYYYISGGQRYPVTAGSEAAMGVAARTTGSLSAASMAMIPKSSTTLSGVVTVAGSGVTNILTSSGQYVLDSSAAVVSPSTPPLPIAQAVLDSYPALGTIKPGSFIISPTNGTVYLVTAADIRPIGSWDALLALVPSGGSPVIDTVPQSVVEDLATGPIALTAGTLVRSPDNATVYFINGITSRIALSTFSLPFEAGFSQFSFASDYEIDGYPQAPQNMTFGMSCGSSDYISAGGSVHLVDPSMQALYPFTYIPMDSFTCVQMKIGTPATRFIRTPDGSIYELVGGQKLPITTMTHYAQLSSGQGGYINVLQQFADLIPTGPLA